VSGHESLLGQIKSPRDLSNLKLSELIELCAEIRRVIIDTVAKNGGHLSSNLGVVELSVALHAVFESPKDKIVWDVGHQCYAHKLLTGRFSRFSRLRQSGGIAGFPRRFESEHDVFDTGHASTSISVALGLLEAERLSGGNARSVAVIGDGALTGGLAYEALSSAGHLGIPLIVLLNDNRMAISPNVGALSRYLSSLSMKRKYQTFKITFDSIIKKIPFFGGKLHNGIQRLKRAVKAVFYHDNLFVDLGFEYAGPIDGHNLAGLISVLKDVRTLDRPVVVHIVTQKGRGYEPAEKDPGAFHSVLPFSVEEGKLPQGGVESWTHAFGEALLKAARKNEKIVAISAAMERGTGLSRFHSEFPNRFFDTGITESHAVSFSAALAAGGFRPVVAIYSTFMQRAVDSVLHDTAIGKFPVVFALDRAGFVSADGETHQGLFDIALFRAVPNMTIFAPADKAELELMLNWALCAASPSLIRYPKAPLPESNQAFCTALVSGRGVLIKAAAAPSPDNGESVREKDGEDRRHSVSEVEEAGRAILPVKQKGDLPVPALCLAFTGSLYPEVSRAVQLLEQQGIAADMYNLRFLKPIDEDYLVNLMDCYRYFYVFEEGVGAGGVGEYIASLVLKMPCRARVFLHNAGDVFYSVGTREELLCSAGLDGQSIASRCLSDMAINEGIG
jgi:1-deoxy-D-xylulose-5-phosphate synthase